MLYQQELGFQESKMNEFTCEGQIIIEFAVGKLDVKQRVLEGNDLISPLAVQGDGNLGHSIFSSSVSRG
jgi:hypothetical protein